MIKKITYPELQGLLINLASRIAMLQTKQGSRVKLFGVPRGGVPVVLGLVGALTERHGMLAVITGDPSEADYIIDDIVDSGATKERYTALHPHARFMALVEQGDYADGQWIVFPWEATAEASAEDIFTRLLQFIGEDSTRGGLLETPSRAARAWRHWCSGYGQDPALVLKVFQDGAESYDQMVTVKDIPLYSHCEHHLAPIFGTATISYIPDGKIVGLSKLSRLVDMYARRLQVQERLTNQIADAINTHLNPKGVGVFIKARHMCMESRGICQQGHHTITTALRGAIKDHPEARSEFMLLV